MRIQFTIDPQTGDDEFHVEINMIEADLKLTPEVFAIKYLEPVAACFLAAFEEPWPKDPDKVLAMMNRGGPAHRLRFYRANMKARKAAVQ
ncbi:MAG TPA: hypothetical protein VGG80_07525 [Acidobacteriaceae bacterium]|jgi:hypothetical protein